MAVEFIAAGIGFPEPFPIGALWPAGLVCFPKSIALLLLGIPGQAARVGIRPIGWSYRPRDVAFGWSRGATLGHLLEKMQRLKSLFGPLFCLHVSRCAVSKAFARSIHGGPEAV